MIIAPLVKHVARLPDKGCVSAFGEKRVATPFFPPGLAAIGYLTLPQIGLTLKQ